MATVLFTSQSSVGKWPQFCLLLKVLWVNGHSFVSFSHKTVTCFVGASEQNIFNVAHFKRHVKCYELKHIGLSNVSAMPLLHDIQK